MNEQIEKLKLLGFTKETIEDALFFCEKKIDENWVDAPRGVRDQEEKDMAKKCNEFKKIFKEIKSEIKLSGKILITVNISTEPYYYYQINERI